MINPADTAILLTQINRCPAILAALAAVVEFKAEALRTEDLLGRPDVGWENVEGENREHDLRVAIADAKKHRGLLLSYDVETLTRFAWARAAAIVEAA